MPQFFVRSTDIVDGVCRITGEDLRHLCRSRRVSAGQYIHLRDERGFPYTARVVSVTPEYLDAVMENMGRAPRETLRLVLCASLLKGGLFDDVVRRAVEVGVRSVVPFVSERTVPTAEGAAAKRERWNRIAREAAKQSMRGYVPDVGEVRAFGDLAGEGRGVKILAHPEATDAIGSVLAGRGAVDEAWLIVGPEGGFSPAELSAAVASGWRSASFGFSQMRAATAAMVLPAIVIYEWSRSDDAAR